MAKTLFKKARKYVGNKKTLQIIYSEKSSFCQFKVGKTALLTAKARMIAGASRTLAHGFVPERNRALRGSRLQESRY